MNCTTPQPIALACLGLLVHVAPAQQGETLTPEQEITPITFLQDGGWCWYQDPRALVADGNLVVGGVSGRSGDVKVGVYDLQAGKHLGTVMLHEGFERDDHNAPAFYARPDGRILAVYARHAHEKVHYYRISEASDFLTWGPEQQFVHDYPGRTGVTYMNLHLLAKKDKLYNFFRDGPTFNPWFMTSADHGDTWGNRTHFISDELGGRHRPYARYLQRDRDTVGVSFTEAHPRNFGNSLYYADFRDDSFFRADGTKIKDLSDGPLCPAEAEQIFKGSGTTVKEEGFESVPRSAWTCATAVDGQARPHLGYTLYLSNLDHRFRIASWDGQKWVDREVAYAGTCLYPRESSYTGLMAFDPVDPTRVYISTDVDPSTGTAHGGQHEIYAAVVGADDDISSIQWEPVTSGSTVRNIRPMVVAGAGHKVLLWLRGPWKNYTDYESDVVGITLAGDRD